MFDKALHYISLLKVYFPNYSSTLAWGEIKKGDIYLKIGDRKKAIETFENVIQNYKGSSVYAALALDRLGDVYMQSEEFERAEKIFKRIYIDYADQLEIANKASIKLKRIENIRKKCIENIRKK